jgi:surface protein
MSTPFTPITKTDLQDAVNQWCANAAAATTTYGDINTWDTINITDMSYLFNAKGSFDSDISNWNTSNVTNMKHMFNGAFIFNQDIGDWDTSSVTDMSFMFNSANKFNKYIGNWNTSNVTITHSMFRNNAVFDNYINTKEVTINNTTYTAWDMSNVINMAFMFNNANVFNQDISNWNTSSVTNMKHMFDNASSFNQDITHWPTNNVAHYNNMFSGATAMYNTYDGTSGFDSTPTRHFFNNIVIVEVPIFTPTTKTELQDAVNQWCANVAAATTTYGDINTWITTAITDMSYLFQNKTTFNSPIGDWDTSSVTDMSYMFEGASVFNGDISNWDVSNVTNMHTMLMQTSFNQDISSWNVSNVTDMINLFAHTPFNQPLNTWDVGKVTWFHYMFQNTSNFNQDIGGWDTSSATVMQYMFFQASVFDQNIRYWDTTSVTDYSNMFQNATQMITNYSNTPGFGTTPNYTPTEAFFNYIDPQLPPICFPKGTPVTTDQGNIAIEKLNCDNHTIRGKRIVGITQTRPLQEHIVCIDKNALGKNVPSQTTEISMNHKVFYKGEMRMAKELVELCENVYFIPYNKQTLYNVLLDKHDKMMINNLICETLSPKNIMAKIINSNLSSSEVNKIYSELTNVIKKNDISGYKKLYNSKSLN